MSISSMINRLAKYNFYFAAGLMGVPLFIDLLNLNLVIEEGAFSATPFIPFPVFVLYYLLSYLILFIFSKKIIFYSTQKYFIKSILYVLIFYFYALFVSDLDLIRTIQLTVFLLPAILLFKMETELDSINYLKFVMCIFMLFVIAHLISIYIVTEDILVIKRDDFVLFFGYDIYQALLTYPAILNLHILLLFFLFLEQKNSISIKIIIILTFITVSFMLFTAARKIAFLELASFFAIFLGFHLYENFPKIYKKFTILKKSIVKIYFLFILMGIILFEIFNTRFYQRFQEELEDNQLDGSRLSMWSNGVEYITLSMDKFLFGQFGSGEPGFHNYLLDTWARVGFVGIIVLFIIIYTLLHGIYKFYSDRIGSQSRIYILSAITYLVLQSTVNSALTQTYYLMNFMTVVLIFLNLKLTFQKDLQL